MLDVCLLGCGGMKPLSDRWLTSLITRYQGRNVLVDCGEGTQVAINEAGWSFKPIDVICFTHFHADHIAGLPGFLLTMGNSGRTEDLTMIGPRGLEHVVNSLRVIAPELPFDIKFIELEAEEETFEIYGYRIKAFLVDHRITCYGYTFEFDRAGKFDVAKAEENHIPKSLWGRLQKGEYVENEGILYSPSMVLGPPRRGLKLTYTTDTRPTESIRKNAKDSDLLICEGIYGDDEHMDRALKHKHMIFAEAADIAKAANAGELWLTHFSPALTNPEGYIDVAKEIFPNTRPGHSGLSTVLKFQE